jgi:branched-chain amino acid transport system permease protein
VSEIAVKIDQTETGRSWRPLIALLAMVALAVFPKFGSSFQIDIATQVFLAAIGALSLMLLTGFAGQISLGHAGLIAAGAFTVGIMSKEYGAPVWVALPCAGLTGALLGLFFGLPSLRLRGLYLAVSTLAMHFLVVYAGGEYETKRGFSTGIVLDPPSIGPFKVQSGTSWYFVMLIAAALTFLLCRNLVRARTGRAWALIRTNETVAQALGIRVDRYKLLAFVLSSTITSLAGGLFAYYRGFVSIEAFSLYLTIQYVAMVIVGGMGSLLGAVLGAAFVTVFPYLIEYLMQFLPDAGGQAGALFAANYVAFGALMIAFLVLEPQGLIGIWRRLNNAFGKRP